MTLGLAFWIPAAWLVFGLWHAYPIIISSAAAVAVHPALAARMEDLRSSFYLGLPIWTARPSLAVAARSAIVAFILILAFYGYITGAWQGSSYLT